MVDEDLEESVHQQDSVREDAAAVQQDRLKRTNTDQSLINNQPINPRLNLNPSKS